MATDRGSPEGEGLDLSLGETFCLEISPVLPLAYPRRTNQIQITVKSKLKGEAVMDKFGGWFYIHKARFVC